MGECCLWVVGRTRKAVYKWCDSRWWVCGLQYVLYKDSCVWGNNYSGPQTWNHLFYRLPPHFLQYSPFSCGLGLFGIYLFIFCWFPFQVFWFVPCFIRNMFLRLRFPFIHFFTAVKLYLFISCVLSCVKEAIKFGICHLSPRTFDVSIRVVIPVIHTSQHPKSSIWSVYNVSCSTKYFFYNIMVTQSFDGCTCLVFAFLFDIHFCISISNYHAIWLSSDVNHHVLTVFLWVTCDALCIVISFFFVKQAQINNKGFVLWTILTLTGIGQFALVSYVYMSFRCAVDET